jgi:hypothetical protein
MSLSGYLFSLTQLLTSVQCNEAHPVCGGCQRHGVECVYSNPGLRPPAESAAKSASKESREKSTSKPDMEYAESDERRLLELRLLYQWLTKSAFTFPGSNDKEYRDAIIIAQPNSAMAFPAWLYSLFSFAAIHIAKTSPSPAEQRQFTDTFHKYLDLALQEHRRDVTNLCKELANAVCMTSSMIRNCTQALVQDRELLPYSPPSQWLYMMNGSGDVFVTAWDWVCDDETSLARRIGTAGPDLSNFKELFAERKRAALKHLLHRSPADEDVEPWNDETKHAYERTLSYIGGIQIAINEGESLAHTFRRIIAFPMFVPKRYIELVEEEHPRALVVLAYYFSYLARLRSVWWVGDTGRREIRAMQSVLKSPWVELLEWPLEKMEEVWDIQPWASLNECTGDGF